jgi:hypothetical protein
VFLQQDLLADPEATVAFPQFGLTAAIVDPNAPRIGAKNAYMAFAKASFLCQKDHFTKRLGTSIGKTPKKERFVFLHRGAGGSSPLSYARHGSTTCARLGRVGLLAASLTLGQPHGLWTPPYLPPRQEKLW